jgi:hypothetical protein
VEVVVAVDLILVMEMEEQGHLGRAALVVVKILPGMPQVVVAVQVLMVELHQLIMLEVMVVQEQRLQLRVHQSQGLVAVGEQHILVLATQRVVQVVVVMVVQLLVELRAVILVQLEQSTQVAVVEAVTMMEVVVQALLAVQAL